MPDGLEFLDSLINYEKTIPTKKWEHSPPARIYQILLQSHPAVEKIKVIHIAGTKGKGSTARYIHQALCLSGIRSGLYTSPHLFRLEERFRIDGFIQKDKLQDLISRFRDSILEHKLTYFEALTYLAMVWFLEEDCQAVVLETGLGGRLDATNFHPRPALCILTPVSFDHTRVLGTTLAAIAGEKAGILKTGVPALSLSQHPSALRVIRERAEEMQAPLTYLPDLVRYRVQERSAAGTRLHILQPQSLTGMVQIKQPGEAYIENFLAAVLAGSVLGLHLNPELTARTAALEFPFHIQKVGNTIVDVSHNDRSIELLLKTLKEYFHYEHCDLCLGILQDKELVRISRLLYRYRAFIASLQVFDFLSSRPSGGKKLMKLLKIPAVYRPELEQVQINPAQPTVFTGSFYAVPFIARRLGLNLDAAL